MGSSVAGLTQGDYRMDGKMELITCASDGEGGSWPHELNNYKDTKAKMSSYLVFNRVNRLEIQSVMLVFLTPLL
jgi:hypothetical protein